ncbi:TPA: transporter substrate-binding domain-containing protein, partial [Enterococcus faecium]|nr:transporter substrate-binding domain-containing protein [Enterococcus faecium]HBK5058398.1 transporter substrate-binding domain-containing protein [Enterococcus faecium]HBK5133804.1 transporter substrate-binding domain-containing protein [Enterococcus faecium]HBK5156847.1 transporter substrate-binding domain-containing protein [Enterococcus faecium]HBK5163150.1 transporter substrate-binding domain-containing protein [Enterococcus faecium]
LENVYFNENESGFLLKEGNDALKKKIDGVLKEMKEDGTTKKISEKYFQTDVSVKPKETMAESVSE